MNASLTRGTIFIILLIMLVTIPIIGVGCEREERQPSAPLPNIELSSTLVPNTDLDVYIFVKQEKPTTVPKDISGTPFGVVVESLALWGIPTEDAFTFGGGLTFASPADAASIHTQIPGQDEIWTVLSNRTIYFVQGSGVAADILKSAISKNDFKYYDDREALKEVSLFPSGGTTKLAGIAIVKPSKTLVRLVARNVVPEASDIINALLMWARLQVITVGLYASQQIDVAEITKDTELINIWESDLGILASVKSGLPGFVVSPIVKKLLDNAGYVKTNLGELTLYKGSFDAGNGKIIPIILRVEGNRMFAAISGEESYAETLIASIKR